MAPRPVDPWRTLGVEEEFFLVDAETGNAVSGAPEMARLLADEPAVTPEFMRYQIETATPVCAGLGQVRAELDRLRRLLVGAADRVGCLLVATGVLPFDTPPTLAAVTDVPRYRDLVDRFPGLLSSASTCGCHVHVGVLSPRYPTVEVRIADVGLSVDDAVLLAGLVRALVATAVEEFREGGPALAVPTATITAALSAAARHGLGGPGIDVFSGAVTAQRQLFQDLLEHLLGVPSPEPHAGERVCRITPSMAHVIVDRERLGI